jgi:hypothetical protein
VDVLARGGDWEISKGCAAGGMGSRGDHCGATRGLRPVHENPDAMPEDVRLAWRFTRATIDHDPSADKYREEIIKRWGPRAVISLAFAMVASRIYPTVKYAMGHGKACTRIVVDGTPIAFDKAAVSAQRG